MALSVKIESFEGPLDLLLHLIDVNKFNIFDIPIVEITSQYMEYVQAMETQDLNIMSEFLVMAATLLEIKAKMLLPVEVNEEGEEIDPREELVQKLLEYKIYKYMSYELKDLHMSAEKAFYREARLPKEIEEYKPPVDYEELVGDATLVKLNEMFRFMLKRQEDKIDPVRSSFGKIEKEEVDLDRKQIYLQNYLLKHRYCSFRELLEKQNSKMEVIVTFLIVLEMMKIGKIAIEQEDLFGEIRIVVKEEPVIV